MRWEIVKDKTEDHWLILEGFDGSGRYEGNTLIEEPTRRVACGWDGCVRYYELDISKDNEEIASIHLCDFPEFIESMEQVRKIAEEFFKDKPNGNQYYKNKEGGDK